MQHKQIGVFQRVTDFRYFWLVLLFIMIIPTYYFMLEAGIYWKMQDDIHVVNQFEMDKCFKDGQIPCRWTPDLGNGYGLPFFIFYPPLPYLVGLVFRLAGFSLITTVKLATLLQILLAALFMYLLGKEFGGPQVGFLAALFYTYGPYHAINIYVRGALAEAWAAVFFPLIFLTSYRLIKKPAWTNILALALAYSFLLISHNPMVLIFTPFLVAWCAYWLYTQAGLRIGEYRNPLLKLFASAFFALSLAAFFLIPLIFEAQFTQVAKMYTEIYYAKLFIPTSQLLFGKLSGELWYLNPQDHIIVSIGYLHWIIPAAGVLLALYLLVKKARPPDRSIVPFLLLAFFAFLAAFMVTRGSNPIWQMFPIIQDIQFPMRFLNLVNFFISGSLIFLYLLFENLNLKPSIQNSLFLIVVLLLIILNYKDFYPVHPYSVTDQQRLVSPDWDGQIWFFDYMPKTALFLPDMHAHKFVDTIEPANAGYQISGGKKGSNWLSFNLDLAQKANVIFPVWAYPGFKLFDSGQEIPYTIETPAGRISVSLEAGSHSLYLKLFNTPLRNFANTWSMLAWILFLILVFISLLKRRVWVSKPGA